MNFLVSCVKGSPGYNAVLSALPMQAQDSP